MDEPVGIELAGELRLSEENRFPAKNVGLLRLAKAFDLENAPTEVRLDGGDRAVGGAVIQQIDLNALRDEIRDDLGDDVGLVVRRDDRDNREGRHRRAFYGSSAPLCV